MSVLCKPGGDWRTKSPTVRDALGSLVTSLTKNPDVTKLSLPAVFLYPYTVLELGAFRALRFCSELNTCKAIKDKTERILGVTRWFLTVVEQMEEMSKKPFNPVLGEELNCWVDSEEYGKTYMKCEQVSHHPPVSALFMDNKKQDIAFTSNVRFGITWHGNSVSCSLVGKAYVEIGGEKYVAKDWVPDAIIQNMLFGTRRQYWKGGWSLKCEKTGLGVKYIAYEVNQGGGWFASGHYVNLLRGYVYNLDDENETPICKIKGTVGRKIYICNDDDDSEEDFDEANLTNERLYLDCDGLEMEEIKFINKDACPKNSSFRVWGTAGKYILEDDTKNAEVEKTRVENEQRAIRKERQENNYEWHPQYFEFDEEEDIWALKTKDFVRYDQEGVVINGNNDNNA